jgi:hypothetical protein
MVLFDCFNERMNISIKPELCSTILLDGFNKIPELRIQSIVRCVILVENV